MSMAKLEFSLPEEEEEFRAAVNGMKCQCSLEEIVEKIRQIEKYSIDSFKTPHDLIEHIRQMVADEMSELR